MKPFSMFFSAGLVALLVACSGGSDPSPGTSSSSSSSGGGGRSPSGTSSPTEESDPTESSNPSGPGTSGPSKPSGATNVACKTTDDCGNWFCDCEDASGRVSPVNARTCNNGWCMDAATACPSACKAFGKTWTGSAGGGPAQ